MTVMTERYRVHPAAALFPMLDGAELAELARDIEEHGLIEPIVVHNGELLDGRNRLAACQLAGVEPTEREWEGDPSEVVAWVLSKNLHRRHLSTSQRALVAARLATLQVGANQHAETPSQTEAAELLGVGRSSVQDARAVLESGDDELVRQVEQGELPVSRAAATVRERSKLDNSPEPARIQAGSNGRTPVMTASVVWYHEPEDLDVEAVRRTWSGTTLMQREPTADIVEWRGRDWVDATHQVRVARGWAPPTYTAQLAGTPVPVLTEEQWEAWLDLRKMLGEAEALRQVTAIDEDLVVTDSDKMDDLVPVEELTRANQLADLRDQLAGLAREELREVLSDQRPADVRAAVRGERRPFDAYYTPDHVARACVAWLLEEGLLPRKSSTRILEGHAGGQAWVRALQDLAIPGVIDTVDLDPAVAEQHPGTRTADFLELGDETWDIIVGNPPFADAEAHVRHALTLLTRGGILAWILRRDWVGAARTALLTTGLAPIEEVVLVEQHPVRADEGRRISFTADGATDTREYSMFVWRGGSYREHWRTRVLVVPPTEAA